MNYRALIKNKDGSIDFVEVRDSIIVGRNYSKYGVQKSDNIYIKDLFNKIFYNENCELLGYSNNYKIYYDKETNLKHFLKDGIEDLEMFLQFNGEDATRYLGKKGKGIIAGIACLGIIVFFGINEYQKSLINLNHDIDYYDYKITKSVNSKFLAENNSEYVPLEYTDALNLIDASNLTEEEKKVLSNKDLLMDVFSYYKGTLLELSANDKFKDINIQTFKSDSPDSTLYGQYSFLYPNVIEINSSIQGTEQEASTLAHEFVHMLQAEGLKYYYIIEGSADLVMSEYYDYPPGTYKEVEKNTKLLMDIIGPEPIIKMLFSGDDDQFLEIIKTNLSEEDAKELVGLLSVPATKWDTVDNIHERIQTLFGKLYKSMYGQDITSDTDIMYGTLYDNPLGGSQTNSRHYFNLRKMTDEEPVVVYEDADVLLEKGIIEEKEMVYCKKYIDSIEEYREYQEDESVSFRYNYYFRYDRHLYGVIDNQNQCFFLFDTPLNEDEYIDFGDGIDVDTSNISGHNISLSEAFEKGYVSATATKTIPTENFVEGSGWAPFSTSKKYISKDSNVTILNSNGPNQKIRIEVNRPGIKVKFADQYNNLANIVFGEENNKANSL